VQVGARTELRDHVAVIDPDELRALALQDSHFADVRVRVAKPGESVRIINALDVVEPRWKVAGPGASSRGSSRRRLWSARGAPIGSRASRWWRAPRPCRASPRCSASASST